MRLLFLSNLYPPFDIGGYEQWCQEMAVCLRERGHTVHILTSRYGLDGPVQPEPDVTRTLYLQADVYHYKPLDFFIKRPFQELSNRRQLRTVLDEFEPDLVLVWGMWDLSPNLPAWAERWLPGKVAYFIASYWPLDTDIHKAYWEAPANRRVTELAKRPFRALALSRLDNGNYPPKLRFEHVMCCSHYVRDTVVVGGAVPPGAAVLFGGTDVAPFIEAARKARKETKGPLRLLYFGSLVPDKGVHTAIEALGLLKARGALARVDFTILGSGHPDYESRLRAMVAELAIGDRVHFAGRVPRDEIPSWLARFDVYLFTSTWPEPMARSVMEAMAAGLLVIGSEVGGQVEMLFNEENGLTFQPGDAVGLADRITYALDHPARRDQLASAGRHMVVERFTLDRMAVDIENWLRGVIAVAP